MGAPKASTRIPEDVVSGVRSTYTAVYAVRGIVMGPEQPAATILTLERDGIQAVLAPVPDDYCLDIDRGAAFAQMLLQGGLRKADPTVVLQEVEELIVEQRAERLKKHHAPFLVVSVKSEIEDPGPPKFPIELGQFLVALEWIDKHAIRTSAEQKAADVITALTVGVEKLIGVRLVTSGVVFDSDGGVAYSIGMEFNAAGYVSRAVTPETLAAIHDWYAGLNTEIASSKITRLLAASLSVDSDNLRRFIAAWTALEITTHKLFSVYETRLFTSLANEETPAPQRLFVGRVRDVMKSKYRLGDKFALISAQLAASDADGDIRLFRQVKKQRDDLYHGEPVVEASLKTEMARDLTAKYLRLFLKSSIA